MPDEIDATLLTLEAAYAHYAGPLGLQAPDAPTYVHMGGSSTSAAVAPPWANEIDLPNEPIDTRYLPAHELAHRFQWTYLTSTVVSDPLSVLTWNWWMEATAEWWTGHYLKTENGHGTLVPHAARFVPAYLGSTGSPLNLADGTLGLAGTRQYGAVAAVTYLAQIFGDDFARSTFAHVSSLGMSRWNGYSQVEYEFAQVGYLPINVYPGMYEALYRICDPVSPTDDSYQLQDPDVHQNTSDWCTQFIQQPGAGLGSASPGAGVSRPVHAVADLSTTSTHTMHVGGGGAQYLDLHGPTGQDANALRAVEVTPPDLPQSDSITVTLSTWGHQDPANPAPASALPAPGGTASPGRSCSTQWGTISEIRSGSYDPTGQGRPVISTETSPVCPFVTVTVVNTGLGPARDVTMAPQDARVEVPLTWTSKLTGAFITNGTVRMGVHADGTVFHLSRVGGADPSDDVNAYSNASFGCQAWGLIQPGAGGATAVDGCAMGFSRHAGPRQGRAATPQVEDPGDPPSVTPVGVTGFTATVSEATSTTTTEAGTVVTHHFHPSAQADIYQMDVSLAPSASVTPTAQTWTYRRSDAFADPGASGYERQMQPHTSGPSDLGSTTTIGRLAGSDTVCAAAWWCSPAFDPYAPLVGSDGTPGSFAVNPEPSGSFQGAATDYAVQPAGTGGPPQSTVNAPSLTMLYGASATEQASDTAQTGAGASSWATAHLTPAQIATPTFTIGYHRP